MELYQWQQYYMLANNNNRDSINDYVVLWQVVEEQLLRSVEGQAASDEEDEKWTGEQQKQVIEVKRILSRLSCCGERYGTATSQSLGARLQQGNGSFKEGALKITKKLFRFKTWGRMIGES